MLPFKIISQSPFISVTLDEAKSQCRRLSSFTLDDDLFNNIILAAADSAQEYLHWMVSEGQVMQYSETGGVFKLYGRFVTSIDDVVADGVTLTTEDYSYNEVTEEITLSESYTDVYITYSCGATSADLPNNVKQGILMLISTMYNNREDFITGLSVEKMPLTSKHLLGMSRVYVS